jgi:hypothetical protein
LAQQGAKAKRNLTNLEQVLTELTLKLSQTKKAGRKTQLLVYRKRSLREFRK